MSLLNESLLRPLHWIKYSNLASGKVLVGLAEHNDNSGKTNEKESVIFSPTHEKYKYITKKNLCVMSRGDNQGYKVLR